MTLLDEVGGDLLGAPTDLLVPELRRGQDWQAIALEDAARVDERSAVATVVLSDGRRMFVPLVKDERPPLADTGHPPTRWRRAEAEDGVSLRLLDAAEPLHVQLLGRLPESEGSRERPLLVDMSNDVRVVDDAVVVKWQLLAEAGSLAGPRMVEHLVRGGFDEMPPPLAVVTWNGNLLASFTGYLPGAQDGWDWMLADVAAHLRDDGQSPLWPALLGRLTARLHIAAARPSPVIPRPVTRAPLTALALHYRSLLTRIGRLDSELRDALRPQIPRFEDACEVLEEARHTEVIPLHGDLHAGQFLRWSGGVAIGDFDGNPLLPAAERGDPGPTAHDVAGLLRSLDHVAIAAARHLDDPEALAKSRAWARRAREEALIAYLDVDGVPPLDERILHALESLSPLHEAVYAAEYLPRWRYVPLTVLRGEW